MKPKIYAFSNTLTGGDGQAVALAEDGTILATHWCSNETWVPHDLGVTSDWKHDQYRAHYPDGYEVVFVASVDFDAHEGLQTALKLNATQPYAPTPSPAAS